MLAASTEPPDRTHGLEGLGLEEISPEDLTADDLPSDEEELAALPTDDGDPIGLPVEGVVAADSPDDPARTG